MATFGAMTANTHGKWDEDGREGRDSSLALVVRWLRRGNNALRWRQAARRKQGKAALVREIREFLVRHGIRHRTERGIDCKLWQLGKQVKEADAWLEKMGLEEIGSNGRGRCKVLQLCPEYLEIAPLLRSRRRRPQRRGSQAQHAVSRGLGAMYCGYESDVVTNGSSTKSEDDSSADDSDDDCGSPRDRRWGPWSQKVNIVKARWDSDGTGQRPSSFSVLLKWIKTPGNAVRWRDAAREGYESRVVLADEIYDFLLAHDVTHRTRGGVARKLLALEQQFKNAENWLKDRGIRHFKDTREAEQTVLEMCPIYSELKTLFQSVQQRTAATRSRAMEIGNTFKRAAHDTEPSRLSSSKRIRIEHHWQSSCRVDTKDTGGVAILEAEPDERREFFELELQVKRDKAICVRAKARKELLDMGVSRDDVDRLLPL